MAAMAARLLPARERDRYLEEFRSELYEIAAVGAGLRQQLQHAARVLTLAVHLRAAVLAPAPETPHHETRIQAHARRCRSPGRYPRHAGRPQRPAVVGAVLIALTLTAALCWTITDPGRTQRLAMIINAIRAALASTRPTPSTTPDHQDR